MSVFSMYAERLQRTDTWGVLKQCWDLFSHNYFGTERCGYKMTSHMLALLSVKCGTHNLV